MHTSNIKTFFGVGVLIVSLLNFLTTPAQAASKVTLKNLYMTVTYPSIVKMPKGDCGTFKVTYKLGLKAISKEFGYAVFILYNDEDPAGGKLLTYNMYGVTESESGESGSFDVEFCKEDWMDPEDNWIGNERIGISAGTHTIGLQTKFGNFGVSESKYGKIKLRN